MNEASANPINASNLFKYLTDSTVPYWSNSNDEETYRYVGILREAVNMGIPIYDDETNMLAMSGLYYNNQGNILTINNLTISEADGDMKLSTVEGGYILPNAPIKTTTLLPQLTEIYDLTLYDIGSTTRPYGNIYGTNIVIGSSTTLNTNAAVTINSTTKGFLPPRMTAIQRNAINTPAEGLIIYNLTDHMLECYNGTEWVGISVAPV